MPRWHYNQRAEDEEDEASSEEEEEELAADEGDADDVDEEDENGAVEGAAEAQAGSSTAKRQGKISIALGKGKQSHLSCHVCGKKGHNAGFVGSVYVDCPNKPCYLCKKPGHTTMTCPHRISPEHGCSQASSVHSDSVLKTVLGRQHHGRLKEVSRPVPRWQVEVAVLRLHSRRCTALEFHPSRDNIVLSGDKKGQVAVWDYDKGCEHTVYNINRALTNVMRFLPGGDGMSCVSSSSDGTLKEFDIETGVDRELLNLNPGGWIPGVSSEKTWGMLQGMDVCNALNMVITGDSQGMLHFVDPRTAKQIAEHQLHKRGNKVNSVHVNPLDHNCFLTASNDWTARLFDLRLLSAPIESAKRGRARAPHPMETASMEHPKVVNSAYFSPATGRKILTTCIDNRLRVWDYIYSAHRPADREIVHSHDFNRYLTPFRAEWDPKDDNERLIVCGRYISEDCGGIALHPIDLIDASTGRQLAQLLDPNLTTISPVNKMHPRQDVIVTGSSRSLYAWKPVVADDLDDQPVRSSESAGASDTTTVEYLLQGNSNFVFYDADEDAAEKKKAAKRRGTADTDSNTGNSKKKKK